MSQQTKGRSFTATSIIVLSLGQFAYGQQTEPNEKTPNAARLKAMQNAITQIEIKSIAADQPALQLHPQPMFRWSSAQSRVVDGAVFVWLLDDRPEAIGSIWIKDGIATAEIQSLSSERLIATLDGKRIWAPAEPGIQWAVIPDAPTPLTTKAERLRQMKTLATDFTSSAIKTPPDYEEGSIWNFRLLPQPIFTYGEGGTARGAIFAFAQGTDPEVYLLIESRKDQKGNERWHYAFAASCVWELHGRLNDREVWLRRKSPKLQESTYTIIYPISIPEEFLQKSK